MRIFRLDELSQDGLTLAVHVAGSSLIALATAMGCESITRKISSDCSTATVFPPSKSYEDRDGVASDESLRRLSDKWQRAGCFVFTTIGMIACFTRQVTRPASEDQVSWVEEWLQLSGWMMLFLQDVGLLAEDKVTRRFQLGWRGSLCHVLMAIMLCSEYLSLSQSSMPLPVLHHVLLAIQFASGSLAFVSGLLLPRRADVFHDGGVVDRQYTNSFMNVLSFAWVKDVITTTKQKQIGFSDLPRLGFALRSSNLLTSFRSTQPLSLDSSPLWKTLLLSHRLAFLLQISLTVCSSLMSFAPQMSLWGLLNTLENNGSRTSLLLWILCLGATTMLASTAESWTYFVAFCILPNRVFGQLWAVIFDKTQRRKFVQEKNKQSDEDDAEGVKSPNQNILSIATIDVQRVADCTAMLFSVFEAPIKFTISGVFLAGLLGWQSLLFGVLSLVLVLPISFFVGHRYRRTQASLLKSRDARMEALSEALEGIRQIKISATEYLWEDQINCLRDSEMAILWASWFWQIMIISYFNICPIVVSSVALAAYLLCTDHPSATVIFTSLSVFMGIEATLFIFPQTLVNCVNTRLSLDRIRQYLESPERDHVSLPSDHVSFEEVTISWLIPGSLYDKPFTLRNINLEFPKGALSVICGNTGSGKSLLLAAILGECEVLSGIVRAPKPKTGPSHTHINPEEPWILDSTIAFVPQTPWIENGSVRSNILFGLPFNKVRYRQVLEACALAKDLQNLVDGDYTEIGPKGVNLSGGQKWRISLARALYSRAGTLVIDDIFSAVDSHTARHLCDHALTGFIASSRTRILATHHLHLCLAYTTYLVHLENGRLRHAGSVDEQGRVGVLDLTLHNMGADSSHVTINEIEPETGCVVARDSEMEVHIPSSSEEDTRRQSARVFVAEEEREEGSIKWSTYRTYLQNSGGIRRFLGVLFVYATYGFFTLARSWWLCEPKHDEVNTTSADPQIVQFLLVYISLSLMVCVVSLCTNFLLFSSSLRASKSLFRQFLHAVLRSPLRWLDTTPLGRILNRFSADINALDTQLGIAMRNILSNVCDAIIILVAGMVVNPQIFLLALALLPFCIQYARMYLTATREVKRLQSVSLSPIIENFNTMMDGLLIIRTFNVTHLYLNQMLEKIDCYTRANWHVWLLVRWLSFRLSTISVLFTSFAAVIIVSDPDMTAAKAGFAIVFAMRLSRAILQIIQMYGNTQMAMNSVERLSSYANMESEAYDGPSAPASWPTQGHLKVSDLVVSYAPDLPPVLKGISFDVRPRQRVGIVGRTGSGKTSLALSLFRFMEAQQGTISLDGRDISNIALQDLRSRLRLIPQDPILFSGTLRSNLDPFDQHSDSDLIDVLVRVHWVSKPFAKDQVSDPPTPHESMSDSTTLRSRPDSVASTDADTPISEHGSISSLLDTFVAPGGTNFSQGQRQKICLARAIISRPKLLILDEATSAIDKGTDALIQDSIREELGRSYTTLLVIAHRISTIAHFDRIIVLDQGQVVENGTPQELACKAGGYFRKLLEESTEKTPLHGIIHA